MKTNFRSRSIRLMTFLVLAVACSGVTAYSAVTDDARAALDRGDYKNAITILEAARKKTPKDAKIHLLLGEAYMDSGRNADAVKSLNQAAAGGQYNAYDMLVDIALEELDPATARETIDRWRAALQKSKRPDSDVLLDAEARTTSLNNFLERVEDVETIKRITIPWDEFENQTADQKTGSKTEVFFTRRDKTGTSRLWSAGVLDDGSLDDERELTEFVGGGNIINPFMLQDGETLYFASDRTGENTLGGYDLYMTRRDGEGGFYEPTNLGMPYNSASNDYLYVIDEDRNLGWWVSDRFAADSVDITIFRPSSTRVNIDSGRDDLNDLALARTIRHPEQDVTVKRLIPGNDGHSSDGHAQYDLVISLGNGRIISSPDDLKSVDSEDLWFDLVDLKAKMDEDANRLSTLRVRYGKGDHSVANEIKMLETSGTRLYGEYRTKLNRLIKMEQ